MQKGEVELKKIKSYNVALNPSVLRGTANRALRKSHLL